MELIRNETSLSEKEINLLREKFKIKYTRMKGWNPRKLTTVQLLEITQHKDWKTPGLLLS